MPEPADGRTPSESTTDWSVIEDQLREELAPRLELVRLLGRGSMASVYLAREGALRRLVAVKVLDPALAEDEVIRLRFEREGQAVASISHPNVVAIYGVDRLSTEVPYLVMQYVKGRTLGNRIQSEQGFGSAEARRIISDLAGALSAAHKRGILHRDIRPENVLVEEETGRVMLMDFGLAGILASGDEAPLNLTVPGEVLGDPRYAGPEVREGRSATELADVYSLGVMAYELLSLRKPEEAARESGTERPPPLSDLRKDVDPVLESVIQRCLSPVPENRPSASDVVRQLSEAVEVPAERSNFRSGSEGPARRSGPDPGRAVRAAIMGQPFPMGSEEDREEPSLFQELKRRRVFRVTIFYLIYAWLAIQVATNVFPPLGLPDWSITFVVVFVILGFPIAIVLGWMFDITPEGVKRTRGRGREGREEKER